MLKKFISKLRQTLAPSSGKTPTSKPASAPQVSAKPAAPVSKPSRSRRPRTDEKREPRPARSGEPRPRREAGPRAGSGPRNRSGRADKPARPERFEEAARPSIKPKIPVEIPPQDTAFSKLGLSDALAFAVAEMGYSEPTPIQAQAIPVVLEGRDVTGSAQTGTGKTAAFALPIIQRLGAHAGRPRCLVREPPRELALQVEEAFQTYAKYTDIDVTVVYGGVGYGKQRADLQRGVDVIAATPGRLLDHI